MSEFARFENYDFGFRRGVFDKCNGKPMADVSNLEEIWRDGYLDGYEGNEVVLCDRTEEQQVEDAFKAGADFAEKIRPQLQEQANRFDDLAEVFWDGFYDAL